MESFDANKERQSGFALWAPWDLFWGSRNSFLFHPCPTPVFHSQQTSSCYSPIGSSYCIRENMGKRSLLEEEWRSPQFAIFWPAEANTLPLPKCSWELSLGESGFVFSQLLSWHEDLSPGKFQRIKKGSEMKGNQFWTLYFIIYFSLWTAYQDAQFLESLNKFCFRLLFLLSV